MEKNHIPYNKAMQSWQFHNRDIIAQQDISLFFCKYVVWWFWTRNDDYLTCAVRLIWGGDHIPNPDIDSVREKRWLVAADTSHIATVLFASWDACQMAPLFFSLSREGKTKCSCSWTMSRHRWVQLADTFHRRSTMVMNIEMLATTKNGPTTSKAMPTVEEAPGWRYAIASFPPIKYTRSQSLNLNGVPPFMVNGLVIVPSFFRNTYPVTSRPLPMQRSGISFLHCALFWSAYVKNKCTRDSESNTHGHGCRRFLEVRTLVNGTLYCGHVFSFYLFIMTNVSSGTPSPTHFTRTILRLHVEDRGPYNERWFLFRQRYQRGIGEMILVLERCGFGVRLPGTVMGWRLKWTHSHGGGFHPQFVQRVNEYQQGQYFLLWVSLPIECQILLNGY